MFAKLMGLETIAPAELHRRLQTGGVRIVDVNSPQSWEQAHVPGALHLDPGGFEAKDIPGGDDAPLVFYCSNPLCRKAPNAARRAMKLGYRDVRVMSAGIKGWRSAGLPTESGRG